MRRKRERKAMMFPKLRHTIVRLLAVSLLCAALYGARGALADAHRLYLPAIFVPDEWAAVDPGGQSLVFWHSYSRERETALQEIARAFNAANSWGITVTPVYQGYYGDIFDRMLTVLNTDEAPDIVTGYQNQLATYQFSNALVDLTTLVNSPKWGLSAAEKEDFFPAIYNQDVFPTFDNQRLGFPTSRSMEILYYNADWLSELGYSAPPTTTLQFQEMACDAVSHPFSGNTGGENAGYIVSPYASNFASWVFAFGGSLYDAEQLRYTLNTPEAVEAMTFLQGLVESGCARMAAERFEDEAEFGRGALLFAVSSSSALPYYRQAVEDGARFAWDSAVLPHTTAAPVMNVYGSSVGIPVHTPERALAAWLFLKYFTTPEVQAQWVEASNHYPVRSSASEHLGTYFAENPQYARVFDALAYGKTEPTAHNYDAVRSMIEEALADILEGADVTARLNQLNSDANELP